MNVQINYRMIDGHAKYRQGLGGFSLYLYTV